MSKILKLAYGMEKSTGFNYRLAMEEASRCLLCEDAPCSKGCPAGTDPAKFIRSLRFKNIKGAAETIRENNPLGGSCAWVCPYDRMCEEECSRCGIDKPIQIGKIQRYLVEEEQAMSAKFVGAGKKIGKKVALIGAGPASLACARELAIAGVDTTIFEKQAKAGGVLRYGITPTRLPDRVVDFDIELIKELGVKFEFGKEIKFEDIEKLKNDYDAVFVGVGLWDSKKVNIEGSELKGVESAIDFLFKARTGEIKELPKRVVVIGGGDVAMDCATTARQLGSEKACICYRRSIEEAPANIDEISFVREMGIPIYTGFAPEKICGENGRVTGLVAKGMKDDNEMTLKADMVIFAIGQEQVEEYKDFVAGDGVFSGGDALHGVGITVVESVCEGKEAAYQILDYIR
ncbi:MAG: FAD-dependent oxidoreductase [Lachnoanaerobaculum saburreum]